MDAWEETAVLIAQDIRDWSERVLEVPSMSFAGLPPCPFARNAWFNESVMIHVTPSVDAVVEIKAVYPPTDDLMHIFAIVDYDEQSAEEFNAWIDEQNDQHFGVWLIGSHPDDETNELIGDYESTVADDYAIVIVQSLTHLVEASEQLRKTGYYSNHSPDDIEYLRKRKEIYDAWKKINPPSQNIDGAEEQ